MSAPSVAVDCRGCIACCYVRVPLYATDDVDFFERKHSLADDGEDVAKYVRLYEGFTGFVLDRGEGGRCAYLGDEGCSVYDSRPAACRVFSCVDFVRKVADAPEEIRAGIPEITSSAVYAAGLERSREV